MFPIRAPFACAGPGSGTAPGRAGSPPFSGTCAAPAARGGRRRRRTWGAARGIIRQSGATILFLDFLAELASYRPDDARDADFLRRLRAFARGPESFLRSNPVGHVTASVIVVGGDGATVLLVSHAKLGGWLQPGGHVEPEDESTFAAALREVREETGLERFATPIGRAILDLDVHEIPALGEEPSHLHFDVKHLLVAEGREAPVAAAQWFSIDEIPSLDRDGSLTRAVRKAQDRLAEPRGIPCSR